MVRLLKENIGVVLYDLRFLDMKPKAQVTQEKYNKLDFMKNICISKDTIKNNGEVIHRMGETFHK